MNGCHHGPARRSAAACPRPEPDLHVVEAKGNTVRCGLQSGRISIQCSRDNDATGNGNDHPNCSEIKKVPQEILTEVVSLGMTRSFWPAGHLRQEDLAPSCGGSRKNTHVSSAPGHLEESATQAVRQQTDSKRVGQMLEGHPVFLLHGDQVENPAIRVKARLVHVK